MATSKHMEHMEHMDRKDHDPEAGISRDKQPSPSTESWENKARGGGGGGVDHGIDVRAILDSQTTDVLADQSAVRRLVRKLDFRLLPCLAMTYSFALIDRVNLPNARIAGMDDDLALSVGDRYSIITMIFFVPYVVFQFPSNVVLRKIGAMAWLPSIVVCWGAVTIGMGFTETWDQLLGLRFILGILEVWLLWIYLLFLFESIANALVGCCW